MNILIILIAFNAGFLAGVCWKSMIEYRVVYILLVAMMIACFIGLSLQNIPVWIANRFRRTKRKIIWDPMHGMMD